MTRSLEIQESDLLVPVPHKVLNCVALSIQIMSVVDQLQQHSFYLQQHKLNTTQQVGLLPHSVVQLQLIVAPPFSLLHSKLTHNNSSSKTVKAFTNYFLHLLHICIIISTLWSTSSRLLRPRLDDPSGSLPHPSSPNVNLRFLLTLSLLSASTRVPNTRTLSWLLALNHRL